MATSNFPSSLDTTSALPASISETANLNSPNHADMHEVTNDAIIEIEEKLGTGDTTASTGAVLIGTGSGASAWDTSPTFLGAVTVGSDGSGHDVVFYSATAGDSFVWDSSEEKLTITGTDGQDALAVADGNVSITDNLDVDGNVDVDGTLEADAITVDGTALNEYIADTVGAMVGSNTESGITVTYEDGDNTLDFTVGTLNQDTTGNAATATLASTITVAALNTADQTVYPLFVDGATGTQGAETVTGFSYNPSSGNLTIGGELVAASLDISGNIDVSGTTNLDAVDIDGQLTLADGSSGAPAIAFDSDVNLGFYRGGADQMALAADLDVVTSYTTLRRGTNGGNPNIIGADSSSRRYKENIENFTKSDWENVYNLQAVKFNWKEEVNAQRLRDFGLIAEDVAEQIPELGVYRVVEGEGDTPVVDSVNYEQLCVYLLEVVKDLNSRLETLEG